MASATVCATQEEEEDATILRFPKEFTGTETLFISEVNLLLEHRKSQNENADDDQELSEVFQKTLEYTQRFSRFKNRETIQAVRSRLTQQQNPELHKFEKAQLANLCPDTAEEGRSLIPSLEGRLDDGELQELLDDLQTHRDHQG
ncbi:DNA-directed RNA polymerase II subunit RPB4-like [Sycon ciliatum]|uniref:DNA-directed RNA polymerase II subunit RPB4-like n=1 Tax=Sycon ciliatum TaxID=27933 RepID=UPI0031F615DB